MALSEFSISHMISGVIERMPSSTESVDSTFSAATEAESEKTEGGAEDGSITPRQTYFMCYATDLLSAYEAVRKRALSGIKTMEDLCVMIKSRIGLEETYARGLEKVANQAFKDGFEAGSFREGLEGLRSDMLNKSVQHRQLATNLSTDILEPLTELKTQLSTKAKALVARASKLQKDTRSADEKYRRSHAKYHRCHREAAVCLKAAIDGRAVPSVKAKVLTASTPSKASSAAEGVEAAHGGNGGAVASINRPEPHRRAMSATLDKVREAMPSASNKKDLVQWFLPSEQHRKEALIEAAQQSADAAEESRQACRANWEALRVMLHESAQEFQQVLTDFQGCEERLMSETQDGMRKHVVFESSALANQQYDLQMLFKVMETVNVEMDLRTFIRSARRAVASDAGFIAQAAEAARNEEQGKGTEDGNGLKATTSTGDESATGTGAGVLSNRADSRGAAVAFQNLFGVDVDLPPPPTEEKWTPPETDGEMPPLCRKTLVELFHVPLMTKQDISRYLDATDPVAGAAASEAAAAAIKALGAASATAGGDRRTSAGPGGLHALADAALSSLPSHYPMVTPAASVFEVLAFARRSRHAEEYAELTEAARRSKASSEAEVAGAPSGAGKEHGEEQVMRSSDNGDQDHESTTNVMALQNSIKAGGDTAQSCPASPLHPAGCASSSNVSSGQDVVESQAQDSVGDAAIIRADDTQGKEGDLPSAKQRGGIAAVFAAAAAAFGATDASPPSTTALSRDRENGTEDCDTSAVDDAIDGASSSSSRIPSSRRGSLAMPVSVSKSSASPCLELATTRPVTYAATLVEDVRDWLYMNGASAGRTETEMGEEEEEDKEEEGIYNASIERAVEALLSEGTGDVLPTQVEVARKECQKSQASCARLLLVLCDHIITKSKVGGSHGDHEVVDNANADSSQSEVKFSDGYPPTIVTAPSFDALVGLLRYSLDRAASDREFLVARNCLVVSCLFAVRAEEYAVWLRRGTVESGHSARAMDSDFTSTAEDSDVARRRPSASGSVEHLPSLLPAVDHSVGIVGVGHEGRGSGAQKPRGGPALCLVERELASHPIWSSIELWEVAMSDSVVMAMKGASAKTERWLPADTLSAMDERFGCDAPRRQLDIKLGQLAFLGHSMLNCRVSPSEVRSLLRKCSSLAMEIPPADLDALMATLNSFVTGPSGNMFNATAAGPDVQRSTGSDAVHSSGMPAKLSSGSDEKMAFRDEERDSSSSSSASSSSYEDESSSDIESDLEGSSDEHTEEIQDDNNGHSADGAEAGDGEGSGVKNPGSREPDNRMM